MRLFLAFAPSALEARGIYDCQQRLQAMEDLPLRWAPPENWHVTAHFLGEVPPQRLPGLASAVEKALNEARAHLPDAPPVIPAQAGIQSQTSGRDVMESVVALERSAAVMKNASAAESSPDVLTLSAAEWFPGPLKPRLLALCATAPPSLQTFRDALGRRLRQEGFRLESRPWRPHLSLARLKGPSKRFTPPALPPLRSVPLQLRELTLFESIRKDGSPSRYQPVERFAL